MQLVITEKPTRDCLSRIVMCALISEISEEIVNETDDDCHFDNPTLIRLPLFREPMHIRINLILSETRIIRLHFRC